MIRVLHGVEDVLREVVKGIFAFDESIKQLRNIITPVMLLNHRFVNDHAIIDTAD